MAATHYVLGEALDRDPFLLFELRGRTKEQVLEALRAARADAGDIVAPPRRRKGKKAEAHDDEAPGVFLGKLSAADYDKLREPMPALHLRFETPPVSGTVLRQLGTPAAWSSDTSPVDLLAPILRAAAGEARRLALAEPVTVDEGSARDNGPGSAGAGAKAKKSRARRVSRARGRTSKE